MRRHRRRPNSVFEVPRRSTRRPKRSSRSVLTSSRPPDGPRGRIRPAEGNIRSIPLLILRSTRGDTWRNSGRDERRTATGRPEGRGRPAEPAPAAPDLGGGTAGHGVHHGPRVGRGHARRPRPPGRPTGTSSIVPFIDGRYATVGVVAEVMESGELPGGMAAVAVRGVERARLGHRRARDRPRPVGRGRGRPEEPGHRGDQASWPASTGPWWRTSW